ncbi:MAG: helix-turn-helix transcriptional regulator [Bacteroidetes bacterium]|nr:helix-turn-helix transcriptional regulator [Bacteroidota bacterium]
MLKRDINKLKIIGSHIRKLRKAQKISQEQLGFESNIPRMQIARVERGEINMGILSIISICQALNISLEEFFSQINLIDEID